MSARPELTLFAAAPAGRAADGRLLLDDKFVSGMALHAAQWAGPVRAVLRETRAEGLPFASAVDPASLPFQATLLAPDAPLESALRDGPGLVLCSADVTEQLALGPAARARGLSVVYGIEYTLDTRMQVARLDRSRGPARRLWSMLWNLRQERHRRAALRAADGIQMNGFPADRDYAGLNPLPLRYLDNRMTLDMMATPADMQARRDRHARGEPLRLIHSGRLEPMKGGHLLVPLARALQAAGVAFTLDIYGAGSLQDDIAAGIASGGLSDRVKLHGPVPFETRLVPLSRQTADVFVSCHVQSDPSCTYLEAMGCGLPVVGFANRMLAALVADSGGGWCAPMGDLSAMAALIGGLERDRASLLARADAALSYAQGHDFAAEFDARMRHLAQAFSRSGRSASAAGQPRHGLAGS